MDQHVACQLFLFFFFTKLGHQSSQQAGNNLTLWKWTISIDIQVHSFYRVHTHHQSTIADSANGRQFSLIKLKSTQLCLSMVGSVCQPAEQELAPKKRKKVKSNKSTRA